VVSPGLVGHICLWTTLPQFGKQDARTQRKRTIERYIQDIFRRTHFAIPAQDKKRKRSNDNLEPDADPARCTLFHHAIDRKTGDLEDVGPARISTYNQAITLEFNGII
jgi:hypothetical protein